MADFPNNAPQMFQLPGPQVPYQGNLGTGAAAGLETGGKFFLGEQQNQLQAQQVQAEAQLRRMEAHKAEVGSALDFIGKIGEQLKYYRPNTQKQAIANGLNALAKVAPEFGIQTKDPTMIPDEAVDLVQSFGKLRAGHLEGKISDADFQKES